jgi:hypothetical protein
MERKLIKSKAATVKRSMKVSRQAMKKERKKVKITDNRNGRRNITVNPRAIKRIIWEYYEQPCAHKNLIADEIEESLD